MAITRFILILGVLSLSAPAHAVDSSGWLKERMYRVTIAAGQEAEPARAIFSDEMVLKLEQPGGTIAVPRALIALAPSPEAVDGLLALMLSYSVPLKPDTRSTGRGVTVGAAGGNFAGEEDRTRLRGSSPSESAPATAPPDPAAQRKQRAWRGVGWYTRTRGCTPMLVDYLRLIAAGGSVTSAGKTVTWRASRPARDILTDLGSLAYPSGEQCKARNDPEFDAVKADAAAMVPASGAGAQLGP